MLCFPKYFCEDISTDELFQTIAHLKNKKSSGPDNISTFILKQCSDILTSPLLHIFNSSLSEGEFPNQLKVAKVVPIFKNGDAMLVSNYRPISLLNVLSKILERLVYKRVLDFLNKKWHFIQISIWIPNWFFNIVSSYGSYWYDIWLLR